MPEQLRSIVEQRAQEATSLGAFSGLQLHHVRANVRELLSMIGRDGMFSTYTKHDIAHVDRMLEVASWLIPSPTAEKMSPADWLMLTLSIYLHDIGLLVSPDEFRDRDLSSFVEFKQQKLFSADDDGRDYEAKVFGMPESDRERFLYEEFVRAHHAQRVRRWIENPQSVKLGAAMSTASEIGRLLLPLSNAFKSDLGLICESHHRDRLDDVSLFPIRKPYGNSPDERVNLQYIAIILRSVDLLQITEDRTPSIAYRFLNPSDPVSQQEWARHLAVHAIQPQPPKDRDGNVDLSGVKNTIEVHARFESEAGFFGLTQYLEYAEKQLRLSNQWADESIRRHGSQFDFPWVRIDQSTIKTEGFLPEQFEFNIDQRRILELLTGHTLYNDSSVVLRELVQNAIDAVRLHHWRPSSRSVSEGGLVKIHWNSAGRELTVSDNGTGMTQEVIENNFLRVGASRYQDPAFRDDNPTFSPISRFGIGVLSAFMVADSVEVTTVSPLEEKARRISLRTVHGKYLIRTLDKETSTEVEEIGSHGTKITIRVRASSSVGNILSLATQWFVVPECEILASVDDEDPSRIGATSVAEALERALVAAGYNLSQGEQKVRVRTAKRPGLELAYAIQWSAYFKQWEFLPYHLNQPADSENRAAPVGTCVEGIRVITGSPGFREHTVWAIANAYGESAPRTNVARSALELTDEYESLIRKVYSAFLEHVSSEIEEMYSERSYSQTRAVAEGELIRGAIQSPRLVSARSYKDELRQIKTTVVESQGIRRIVSLLELNDYRKLCSVEDDLFRNAENLLRQVPTADSLGQIAEVLPDLESAMPSDPMLVNLPRGRFERELFNGDWEVRRVMADVSIPRLSLLWGRRGDQPLWVWPSEEPADVQRRLNSALNQIEQMTSIRSFGSAQRYGFAVGDVEIEGLAGYDVALSRNGSYFLPGGDWERFFTKLQEQPGCADVSSARKVGTELIGLVRMSSADRVFTYGGSASMVSTSSSWNSDIAIFESRLLSVVGEAFQRININIQDSFEVLRKMRMRTFDINDWRRSNASE